jgi:uncharacterized protein (DUF924 family)
MTNEELAEKITELLMMTAPETSWPMKNYQMKSAITQILNQSKSQMMDEEMSAWKQTIDSEIHLLVKDWEERMPEDKTLYSLGLRHALDVVRGKKVETS